MENIPKQTLRSKLVWATISGEKTEECMASEKKPPAADPAALATTETDFARSVDREIIRQVGGMNLRGLRILREALAASKTVLPAAASTLREDWLTLDDAALASVADCPYLLFDLATDTAFTLWRRAQAGGPLPRLPPGLCEGQAGAGFARLVCYFAWQTSQSRPAAASLLLGVSPAATDRRTRRDGWPQRQSALERRSTFLAAASRSGPRRRPGRTLGEHFGWRAAFGCGITQRPPLAWVK
jgi:hypothetical protein